MDLSISLKVVRGLSMTYHVFDMGFDITYVPRYAILILVIAN